MQRNLTLTLDGELLKAARKVAIDHDTSVNQLVRDYLAGLVRESDGRTAARRRLEAFFRTSQAKVGPVTWTREDLHER